MRSLFAGVDGQFNLNDNLYTDTLFMVDEASMVSNLGLGDGNFGSGLSARRPGTFRLSRTQRPTDGHRRQGTVAAGGEEESPALQAMMLGRLWTESVRVRPQ